MAGAILVAVSLALILYTYAGYPLLLITLAKLRRRNPRVIPSEVSHPSVTIVLVAHNEEPRVESRLRNLLESDYPESALRVVVVCDGCTDGTAQIAEREGKGRVTVVVSPDRRGKAAGINMGVAAAAGEIVVFADARQRFAATTIRRLVEVLADPSVGAVSGELEVAGGTGAVGEGVGLYWRLERALRYAESRLDSCIGCTGAVYAIRRDVFRPLPQDTILDDVVLPMQIALQGRRIAFEPAARAWDPQPFSEVAERVRKRRTMAGNFQMLCRYPDWMLPWRNRLWWALLSHKYLRLGGPAMLLGCLAGSALLVGTWVGTALLVAQAALYATALAGLYTPLRSSWVVSVPAGFLFRNVEVVEGLLHYVRGGHRSGWERAGRAGEGKPCA